ncbi:unnamed protein product [Darwinula stevensoni]|uniref:Dynein light chain n=1 Tax=Darwinula stevensoni TaxID=69355 RepID=A0A7R9A9C0_9CRUS|nr:unnamed protein product [Darwinula stevensoni]CAG0897214.1 unnamed protein product [Darwinula stevensoni]
MYSVLADSLSTRSHRGKNVMLEMAFSRSAEASRSASVFQFMHTVSEPVVKSSEMTGSMEIHALALARRVFARYRDHLDAAQRIAEGMKEEHGGAWNCIVGPDAYACGGRRLGRCLIVFYLGEVAVTLFKHRS